MLYFGIWAIFWAIVGSFGTAYMHQRTGRDITMGGMIGLVVGAIGGVFLLMLLWLWIYYGNAGGWSVGRAYNSRKSWLRWWE
jgi:hypothetical protein